MDPFEVLALYVNVAIVVTGFSGVVLVFGAGAPSSSEHAKLNLFLFRLIFSGTLTPLWLIAVALLLDAVGLERPQVWQISSAVHVVTVCMLIVSGRDRLEESRSFTQTRFGRNSTVVSFLTLGLAVLNVVILQQFWPLLLGICFGIGLSLYAFLRLVFSAHIDR